MSRTSGAGMFLSVGLVIQFSPQMGRLGYEAAAETAARIAQSHAGLEPAGDAGNGRAPTLVASDRLQVVEAVGGGTRQGQRNFAKRAAVLEDHGIAGPGRQRSGRQQPARRFR